VLFADRKTQPVLFADRKTQPVLFADRKTQPVIPRRLDLVLGFPGPPPPSVQSSIRRKRVVVTGPRTCRAGTRGMRWRLRRAIYKQDTRWDWCAIQYVDVTTKQ